ncbi:MAG TPA: hypothetical protein PKJ08_10300 [Candidatus Cloacimonadota bacterium]|nr:hypothetical protein [Candidatus Cloacimonadota bacterium]HOD54908.1 hypothetical protein [Candidatus Cloacimonadota bacterium]
MKSFRLSLCVLVMLLIIPLSLFSSTKRKFDTDFLIHIRIYESKDEKYSRELKQLFSEQMDKFQRKIKQYPDIHVYIRISPNDKHYKELAKNRSRIVEFSDGFTDLRTKEIFLKNPRSIRDLQKYTELVLHEYIHLFISWYWPDAPLWFHEGMAVYFSEGISFERYSDFMRFYAYRPMNLIKDNPNSYPENPHFYSPYYFQSAQAVKKIYLDRQRDFEDLWDYKRMPFDKAFLSAFNSSTESFLNNFDHDIRKNFLNGILFLVITLIWSALPVLVIIGALRKKRISRDIIKDWEKEQLEEYEYIPEGSEDNKPDSINENKLN